jgi:hypothetical protein
MNRWRHSKVFILLRGWLIITALFLIFYGVLSDRENSGKTGSSIQAQSEKHGTP